MRRVANQQVVSRLKRAQIDLGAICIKANLFVERDVRFLDDALFTRKEELFVADWHAINALLVAPYKNNNTIDGNSSSNNNNNNNNNSSSSNNNSKNVAPVIVFLKRTLLFHQ